MSSNVSTRYLVRRSAGAAVLLLVSFGAFSCTSNSPGSGGTGGKAPGTGGASTSTGGSPVSSGGSPGSGGAPGGTGGSVGSGGSGTSTGGSATGTGGGSAGRGGTGGTGTGGSSGTDAGVDAATDGGAADAVVPRDAATTDAGAYVRTAWTAVSVPPPPANPNTANPPSTEASLAERNAFDTPANNMPLGTRWGTGEFQQNLMTMGRFPLTFTLDMKLPVSVSRITMHPGTADIFDSPMSLDVYVSLDGITFGTAVLTAHVPPAAGGTDTIMLPTRQTAQFIKFVGTQPRNGRWWAIGDLNVYP